MLGKPSDIYTDWGASSQDVTHLFACTTHTTDLSPEDLWRFRWDQFVRLATSTTGTLTDLTTDLAVANNNNNKRHLPYITANTPTQHGHKAHHSTVTEQHILNNTVAKGFKQMAPPARTITVALDMSKAFNTINIHTLISKLLHTKIPGTIIKFIANNIKGCKACTTYINHTSSQRQFKIIGCTSACVCVCGWDGDIVCVGHDLNRCTEWW